MTPSERLFEPLQHTAGFAFHACNPLIDEWIRCWDGTNPLLDIGCGNCINTLKAVQVGATVTATELDRTSLQQLQKKHSDQKKPAFCLS
ncbi:MAG: methyltransferase domain-containing protein [Endozoicomonas sp.]|uniref:methyltransferase domain-containing protein n=1 Tax=Endozoicomonas sp. TaxID=1892382 RepID=UPI003D9B4C5F